MWTRYFTAHSLEDALRLLSEHRGEARIVAGATDLILELERGGRKGVTTLIDVSRIPDLDGITLGPDGFIHLGPLVTHNQVASSRLIARRAFAMVRACWMVGSPQIRNRGTVAGNLITASPANDSIPPLMALGARVTLRSIGGERTVRLCDFYQGVRRTVMRDDEMLTDIAFECPPEEARTTFVKFALRRAQAISVVNAAVSLTFDGGSVRRASLTLGAVAPTIIHADEAEAHLLGKPLNAEVIDGAAELAADATRPIDDLRGSAQYRKLITRVIVGRALRALASGKERQGHPDAPIRLASDPARHRLMSPPATIEHQGESPIDTTINGKRYVFQSGYDKTLLRLLREEAGLIGTKEGCAEGECGACTVFLDGNAVMACMVPAPRAHLAEIMTVEGLALDGRLHPVQQGFIDAGAVQCGYCTPGFVMSAVKLLEERPRPTRSEIEQALTGNLCRCTGYYSIAAAIDKAAMAMAEEPAGV